MCAGRAQPMRVDSETPSLLSVTTRLRRIKTLRMFITRCQTTDPWLVVLSLQTLHSISRLSLYFCTGIVDLLIPST